MNDLRFAITQLVKHPAFTVVAVLTLALGIGANTALFSVVHGVLLKSLPYEAPERLVILEETNPVIGRGGFNVSYPNFSDWREQATSFEAISAFGTFTVSLRGGDAVAQRVLVANVSADLFGVLHVVPTVGRLFSPDEDQLGADPVAVIAHALAEQRFGSAGASLGQTVSLSGSTVTVIGVLPAHFAFPDDEVGLWIPVGQSVTGRTNRAVHTLYGLARLRDGVSIEEAQTEMATIAERIQQAYPAEDPGHSASVTSLHEIVVGDVRTAILVLFAAVGFVLLIASANVADLMLARLASRRREIAVRTALGATKWRIARQMVTEALVLAGVSGLLALVVALWGVDLLARLLTDVVPRASEIALDPMVLAFAFCVTLLAGLLFGVLPALRSAARDMYEALTERSSSGTRGGHRVRAGLAVGQVAVSLVLLTGAGLMLKSFWRLQQIDPGFEPEQVLSMTVSLSGTSLGASNEDVIQYYRDLRERIEAIPGVVSASGVNALPISGGDSDGQITVEGRTFAPGEEPAASYRRILPDYFVTMGIPMVEGREFTDRDGTEGDSAVIVSETMARQYWPDGGAVGTRIKIGPPEFEPWLTIVGVAGDVRNVGLVTDPGFATYEPHQQRVWRTMNLVVRTSVDPGSVVPVIREEIRRGGLDALIYGVTTMRARIAGSLAARRFNTALLVAFAGVALVLAMVGLYGVVSYSVVQRTREFGIRMAMGAKPADVVAMVLREGMGLIGIGVAVGVGASLLLTRAIRGMLFDVAPSDPLTFSFVAGMLVVVALVASYLPARRATRFDPMQSLRFD